MQFKDQNNDDIGQVWNDSSDGRWQKTLNAKVGDEIKSHSRIYGSFEFNNPNIGKQIISYDGARSGGSNTVKIFESQLNNLFNKLWANYTIFFTEESNSKEGKWTSNEVSTISKAFEIMPRYYYENENGFQIIKKVSSFNKQSDCVKTSGKSGTLAYVSPEIEDTFVYCSLSSQNQDYLIYQTTIHEITHHLQKIKSSPGINQGANVINDRDNILYKYYDVLFNVEGKNVSKKWIVDKNLIDLKVNVDCNQYNTSDDRYDTSNPYFLSWYQCINTMNQRELPEGSGNFFTLPEEEMAESVGHYWAIKEEWILDTRRNPTKIDLKDQDHELYKKDRKDNKNLGRFDFIKNNLQ